MQKEYDTKYTDQEAFEGAYNLLNFFRVLIKMDKKIFLARKNVVGIFKEILKIK
jgi:hypothetical protein